jgi:hypothetical protein
LDVQIGAIATSPNGWTDNELGTEWFKQTFIPFATSQKKNDDPIILLLDGHDSHETDGLRALAYEHNVIVIAFPSKCTHKLQPLDVVVFAQTQRNWSNHCDRRIYENSPMNRYNVIQEYMKVRDASMTPELCSSAFSCTGIYPLNPTIFTDEDFAPAKSFSTSMHVPKSFPRETRSSPPLPSDLSDCAISLDDESDLDSNPEGFEPNQPITEDAPPPPVGVQIDWDTDSDDFDYEPPSDVMDHTSASCPVSLVAPSSCLPASPDLPAAQPSEASAHGSHNSTFIFPAASTMPSAPPMSSTPATTSVPIGPHSALYKPSDDFSVDPETLSQSNLSQSASSRYFTRSQKHSSPAVSVSVALDQSRTLMPSSVEEMGSEIVRLRMTLNLMEKELLQAGNELLQAKAEANASNAHCTIMTRAASEARAQVEQHKRKTRRAVKNSARYVTHDTIHAQWVAEQEEKAKEASEAARKAAQKAANEAARNLQIQEDIRTKVFSGVSIILP